MTREGLTDPDDVPEPPDEAITQPGDLWLLGRPPSALRRLQQARGRRSAARRRDDPSGQHRPAVQREGRAAQQQRHRRRPNLVRGSEAPPVASTWRGTRRSPSRPTKKLRAKDRPLANDFVSRRGVRRLLAAWFGNIARVLEPGRGFYIWGGYANCGNYPPVLKACELYFSQAHHLGQSSIPC